MKKRNLLLSLALCAAVTPVVLTTTGCHKGEYSRSTGQYMDDKTISTKVKSALLADPNVAGTQVDVTTYDGVVQLGGFVDTAAQKARAEEIARGTAGVRGVQNNITLRAQVTPPPTTPPGTTPPQ